MNKVFLILCIILFILPGCSPEPEIVDEKKTELTLITETYSDVFKEPNVLSPRIGQFLFNENIEIIESTELWAEIKKEDLHGYVLKSNIYTDIYSERELEYKYKIVITGKEKIIYANSGKSIILKKISMGTILYSNETNNDMYLVEMPGKLKGWITNKDIIILEKDEDIKVTTAEDFAGTARHLLGVKYMDKGRSSYGIDNISFIELCLYLNGVMWDTDEKLLANKVAADDKFIIGDIIYISNIYNEEIFEYGIYLGNEDIIIASKSKGYVYINKISNILFSEEISYAIRVFK